MLITKNITGKFLRNEYKIPRKFDEKFKIHQFHNLKDDIQYHIWPSDLDMWPSDLKINVNIPWP